MNISQNIQCIIKEKKHTQKELATYLGIATSTINNWIKLNRSIPSEYIIPICEFLNVTPFYLLTGEEKSPTLPEDELKLLKHYKRLPHDEKVSLISRAEAIADVYEEQVETHVTNADMPMIEIKHSYYKVSAGTGYDLSDGDQWGTIEIPDTSEAQRADFALTISGDSMEPVYYDGDIVLIKSQPVIDSGEIGIFIIENSGYIKKYGGDKLISLNAMYDDIMFSDYDSDDIRCMGLVIGRV